MKTLHIQLEDETHRKLKQLAAEKDMSMKDLIVFLLPFDETPPTTALYTKEVSSPIRPDIQKGVEDGTISIDKPEKNNSVGKPTKKNICPEHLVDRDICRLMKHKGNK